MYKIVVEESKRQRKRIFIDLKGAIKVIMNCRATSMHKFNKIRNKMMSF